MYLNIFLLKKEKIENSLLKKFFFNNFLKTDIFFNNRIIDKKKPKIYDKLIVIPTTDDYIDLKDSIKKMYKEYNDKQKLKKVKKKIIRVDIVLIIEIF